MTPARHIRLPAIASGQVRKLPRPTRAIRKSDHGTRRMHNCLRLPHHTLPGRACQSARSPNPNGGHRLPDRRSSLLTRARQTAPSRQMPLPAPRPRLRLRQSGAAASTCSRNCRVRGCSGWLSIPPRRPLLENRARLQERHPVRDLVGEPHLVRGQDHRHPQPLQLGDDRRAPRRPSPDRAPRLPRRAAARSGSAPGRG